MVPYTYTSLGIGISSSKLACYQYKYHDLIYQTLYKAKPSACFRLLFRAVMSQWFGFGTYQ